MATARLVTGVQDSPAPGERSQSARPVTPLDTSVWNEEIKASIDSVRQEVDDAYADMRSFHNLNPDEVMRMCGGHSARLSELRVLVMRIEDWRREWKSVRTRELEPALEELDKQYTIASRLHSVRELDWKMEAGER